MRKLTLSFSCLFLLYTNISFAADQSKLSIAKIAEEFNPLGLETPHKDQTPAVSATSPLTDYQKNWVEDLFFSHWDKELRTRTRARILATVNLITEAYTFASNTTGSEFEKAIVKYNKKYSSEQLSKIDYARRVIALNKVAAFTPLSCFSEELRNAYDNERFIAGKYSCDITIDKFNKIIHDKIVMDFNIAAFETKQQEVEASRKAREAADQKFAQVV